MQTKELFTLLFKEKKLLFLLVFCLLIYGFFSSLAIWSVSPLFSVLFEKEIVFTKVGAFNPKNLLFSFLSQDKKKLVGEVAFLILTLFLLRNIFAFCSDFCFTLLSEKLAFSLRKQVFKSLLQNHFSYFETVTTGENISKVTSDVEKIRDTIFQNFVVFLREPILAISYLFVVVWISPKLTFLAFSTSIFSLLLIVFLSKKLKTFGKLAQEKFAKITQTTKESFDGILIFKAFQSGNFIFGKFSEQLKSYFLLRKKLIFRQSLASPLSEFLGISALTFVLFSGSYEVLETKTLSADEFVVFLLGLFELMSPIKKLSQTNALFQEGKGVLKQLKLTNQQFQKVKLTVPKLKEIRFEKVSFKYPQSENFVFTDFDFTLETGKIKVLQSPNGTGKTTLVKLLLGLLKPTSGEISAFSKEGKTFGVDCSFFSLVPQEVKLFDFSLEENLTFGEKLDLAKAEKIFEILGLTAVLEKLPKGLQTNAGDLGNNFSGGEKQKFSLARGLLRETEVLILDEPTTYLDKKTIDSLLTFLETQKWFSMVLLISHSQKMKE
ncbi:ABC transporter ATP-binding protein [bacterium]|nr:ABC transporter ATP-binding protein [bacterium]